MTEYTQKKQALEAELQRLGQSNKAFEGLTFEDFQDPEGRKLHEKLFTNEQSIREINDTLTNIARLQQTFPELKLDRISISQIDSLNTMSNREFLELPHEKRLQYLTV